MTIERLELLSDEIIYNLADKIGIRTKTDWERSDYIASIVEVMEEERVEKESLLNIAQSIEAKKYSVTINEQLDLAYDVDEEMILPDRYNENTLHFLLRDNSWAFILWDVRDSVNQRYIKEFGDIKYVLRVVEVDEETYSKDAVIDFFDVEVELGERRRYINLPSEESYYFVELLITSGDREVIIERSQIVKSFRDRINCPPDIEGRAKKILKLSGFSVACKKNSVRTNINRILSFDSMEDNA